MAESDYYDILGISKAADAAQIRNAYRDLALKFHPDRNQENPQAVTRMKQLNEAYAVLSDPVKRQEYDSLQKQFGSTQGYNHFKKTYSDKDIFSQTDIHKIFDELAASFGFRNFSEISKEFYGKNSGIFEFKKSSTGFGGFFFFGRFKLGKSSFSPRQAEKMGWLAKSLLKTVMGQAISHQGKDLYDTISIDPDLARNGGPYAYYHRWRSKKLVVKIPPNVRSGKQIRLAGMGNENNGQSGDLYLKVETNPSLISKLKKYLPF